jgi:hypothetical protein
MLLAALLALAEPARAARMATIVRGTGAGSEKAAALVGHYVHEQLSKDERYEVVDLSKALGNPDRDKALRNFQAAEELVQKGHDAYDALELDAAVDYLTNTLTKYERQAAYVADFKKVAEALMLLGATHILRGEEKLGTKRLEQAINVYPHVEPDPRIFNPAMRVQFQETSNRLGSRPSGTLSLTSNPSYCEVYVDGKFVGVTPLAVEGLTEGRHYVRLEKNGYRAWGKVLEVTGRSETAESAVLKTTSHFEDFDAHVEGAIKRMTPASEADDRGKASNNEAMDQLGVLTNADLLFLAQVRLDGERVIVWANQYDLNAQKLLKAAEHVFAYEGRAETYEREVSVMLQTSFGAEMQVANKPAGGKKPEAPPEIGGPTVQPRCFRGWQCSSVKTAVTAVGSSLGAIGVGVGVWQWLVARNAHNRWKTLEQTDKQQPILSVQGRNAALRGDIAFGAGFIFAAIGGYAYFMWEPTPSAEDVLAPEREEKDRGGREPSKPKGSVTWAPLDGGGLWNATWTF